MNTQTPIFTAILSFLMASLASTLSATELILSTETLTPNSTLELRFDDPVIAEDQVGTTPKNSPLLIDPPIPGGFKWTSTRSGQYTFTAAPKIDTTYQFSVAPNLKTTAGKPIPSEVIAAYATDVFKIADVNRTYAYEYGDSARRNPEFLLQFNDTVDVEKLAAAFHFIEKTNSYRIPVKARLANGKDFRRHYISSPLQSWNELASGIRENIPLNDQFPERQNAVIITSAEPLPVGKDWRLEITSEFSNLDGNATLAAADPMIWGTIQPLTVKEIKAENHFDSAHEIVVTLNKSLHQKGLTVDQNHARLASHVSVNPPVPNLKIKADYNRLMVAGEFELSIPYELSIETSLTGSDDLPLAQTVRETVTFHPSAVFLSTTANHSAQQAQGNGILDFYAANYKTIQLRVKKLTQGELVQARSLHHDSYRTHDAKPEEAAKKVEEHPFESFPGTVVYDQTFTNDKPLEKSTLHHLKWRDILGETPAAPVFLEFTATPQDGAPPRTLINRAIVEFTDIGLLIKNNRQEIFAYAFSYKTGQPLPNVQLTLMDEKRAFLSHTNTGVDGVATSPAKNTAWILARNGDDTTAINLNDYETRINLWHHHVNVSWRDPFKPRLETLFFSDRPVYKPGDTVHLKAITRKRSGDTLSLSETLNAKLIVSDPRNREIISQPITFSPNGTWTHDLVLPDSTVGYYSARIVFTQPSSQKPNSEADEEDYEGINTAYLDIRVDEYKPNSFEVHVAGDQHQIHEDHISIPLSANYYMGKALTKATVHWSASLDQDYAPPSEYASYHFGDVGKWWRYGQDQDQDQDSEDSETAEYWSASGEISLNEEGAATINVPSIPPHQASLPQFVTVYSEVTDINQQTITNETSFQIPGADFIIGARTNRWYANVNQPYPYELVAITPDGKPFTQDVPVNIIIERQQWNTVRVESAGGAMTTKNQSTLIKELETTVTLNSTNQQAAMALSEFTPANAGTYFLTATTTDPNGKTILSRIAFYTLGGDTFPWAWDDGSRITLQPDKISVKPGEDITIVTKSPLSGKALVTVERNHVHRHFLTDISPANPVITIKAEDIDAPNAFVSVILIRGAEASPQPDPMPEYKVGYCNIKVHSETKKLFVDLKPTHDPVLPAGELTIQANIKDAAQLPVAGAELTLYAVDEGVLSLMDYLTPNPEEIFYQEALLGIKNHTTIDVLIPEALKGRHRGNKGILIGGGGDEASADEFLRKNFVATALWQANLVTDAQGRVTHTFKVPDNLTRYRIMAVAVKDADRFGSSESTFTINKPLMVEPAMPRFAHRGDELLVKAIVHNTTSHRGQVEVELKLDENAEIINEERPFALIQASSEKDTNRQHAADHHSEKRLITLEPNQTTSVSFPIHFLNRGTTTWQWNVKTTEWNGPEALHDGLETHLEVTHPTPSLKEVQYVHLKAKHPENHQLTKKINPQLLESEGQLKLTFSQSRLSEARDALSHVLQYPYGCVEQTTSRLLPWLALTKYESLFPELIQKDKARDHILRGTNRILSMQTETGGLGYWPGSETAELWASAYGGFALIKAKEYGIPIHQHNLDQLTTWISEQLRELDLSNTEQVTDMEAAAMALYTLAKAGKAENAYQTTLYRRRQQLSESARAFLALSMSLTKAPATQISELLKPVAKPSKGSGGFWLGNQTATGLRLIAHAHLGQTQQAEALIEQLFQTRQFHGHWGTTFSNAWILLGLSTNERSPSSQNPLTFALNDGTESSNHTLSRDLPYLEVHKQLPKNTNQMRIVLQDHQEVRARIEVEAWPDPKTFQPVNKGFTLKRSYQRLTTSGSLEPIDQLRVGDMIVVTLDIGIEKPHRYLVIEDHLPSVFEPINPEFKTQNARGDAEEAENAWYTDHRELRHDKALFFTNDWEQEGHFQLKYLARVIAEGSVIAPPAKIEAMYQPSHYALTAIDHINTLPAKPENVVKK